MISENETTNSCDLFFAQQGHRVDSESAPGWDRCSENAHTQHGEDNAAKDERVFWSRLVDDRRKNACSEHAEDHSCCRADNEQAESPAKGRAEYLALICAQCNTETQFAEPFAHGVRCHAEDSGNG